MGKHNSCRHPFAPEKRLFWSLFERRAVSHYFRILHPRAGANEMTPAHHESAMYAKNQELGFANEQNGHDRACAVSGSKMNMV